MKTVEPAPERYLSGTLARFVHDLQIDDLPAELIAIGRKHLLDTIGCCLAAKDLATSKGLAAWLVSEGGAEQATAIGASRRLPARRVGDLRRGGWRGCGGAVARTRCGRNSRRDRNCR